MGGTTPTVNGEHLSCWMLRNLSMLLWSWHTYVYTAHWWAGPKHMTLDETVSIVMMFSQHPSFRPCFRHICPDYWFSSVFCFNLSWTFFCRHTVSQDRYTWCYFFLFYKKTNPDAWEVWPRSLVACPQCTNSEFMQPNKHEMQQNLLYTCDS